MPLPEWNRIAVGAHSIGYRQAGAGPPVVLLHGFLCDSRSWRTQLEGLSDAFSVIAWDAPGAGASSDPPETFTITDWAHVLARFLDAVKVGPAHFVGLSWGGVLAQELYRLEPNRVRGLILADTYAGWKGSLSAAVAEQRLGRCRRESLLPAAEFVRLWVPNDFFTAYASAELVNEMSSIVGAFHPHGFRLMAQSLAESDTIAELQCIGVPTLLVWGDSDARSPVDVVGAQFRDAIHGSEMVVLERAGHLSNMERPSEFNAHVRRFCSERGGHTER